MTSLTKLLTGFCQKLSLTSVFRFPRLLAHEVDGVSRVLVVRLAQRDDLLILGLLAHPTPLDTDGVVTGYATAAFMTPLVGYRTRQGGHESHMTLTGSRLRYGRP